MSERVIKSENVRIVAKPPLPHLSFLSSLQIKGGGPGASGKQEAAPVDIESAGRAENHAAAAKEAYDRGYSAGLVWQKNQSLQALNACSELLRETGDLKRKLYAESEAQILSLVMAVAAKVVCDELVTNDRVILAVLREAVKNVVEREGMKIRLNPRDFRSFMEMKDDLLPELKNVKNLTWEEDEGIKQGGAVLETVSGEVDARLEQRLKEVKNALEVNSRDGGR